MDNGMGAGGLVEVDGVEFSDFGGFGVSEKVTGCLGFLRFCSSDLCLKCSGRGCRTLELCMSGRNCTL